MLPRKSKLNLGSIAYAIAGICFLGLFATLTSNNEIAEHSNVLMHLQESKIAQHNLNENILRLRTFMLNSYDPLVRDGNKLRTICNAFKQEDRFRELRRAKTQATLGIYCAGVEEKIEQIERYKSQHSVLRNSMNYLPLLISQLDKTSPHHQGHALLAELLRFNISPSAELEMKIATRLRALPNKGANKGRAELDSLGLHAGIVLKQVKLRAELEQRILSAGFISSIERLGSEYLSGYQARQRNSLFYYYALILICFGLGVLLFKFFLQVKQSTESLQDLNLNLEKKVAARTQELSGAMEQLSNNQQLLMQSTKMTALGEMAGGIAHEINTPLGAILLNAGVLMENLDTPNRAMTQKRLEAIIKIVERVSKIIMGLKRFARSSDGSEKFDVKISTIVEDTLSLCSEKLISSSVDVQIDEIDASIALKCVPEQISQVLLNFLNNSLDAMRELVAEDKRWIKIVATRNETHIEFSVTDAGPGLSEAVHAKIMQPFFTTKPPGVGTGLGLSISKGIVEQHGGTLYYDKTCPNTRFVMRFPVDTISIAA